MTPEIVSGNIGVVGGYDLALTNGKLVLSITLGPKVILDALAAKIGGPVPAAIATFIENTFALT